MSVVLTPTKAADHVPANWVPGIRMQITEAEITKLYNDHLPLARRIALMFVPKLGLPYDDCLDEAQGILTQTVCQWSKMDGKGYNPQYGRSPTSWIYSQLYWRMLDVVRARVKESKKFPLVKVTRTGELPKRAAPENWVQRVLRELGEDAQFLVSTITNGPTALLQTIDANAPLKSRKVVKQYFKEVVDWDEPRLEAAWQEVIDCIK